MKFRHILLGIASIGAFVVPQAASAYNWMYEGYVNAVEPTCMPVSVGFQTDNGAGSCPAGSWLNWLAKGSDAAAKAANTQAVLSVLITAQVTHRKVRLHGNNLNCTIDFIHLL